MPIFVEIAVNIPQGAAIYHYHLPPELEGLVLPGHLVSVPVRQQVVYGVVLRQVAQPEVPVTRPVLELVDPAAVLTAQQIQLAEHLSQSTLAPLASCISLMLPPGLMQQADSIYSLKPPIPTEKLTTAQVRLISLLEKRGALRGQQLDHALPKMNWRSAARSLERQGLLDSQPVLPTPRVHPKVVRTARLAVTPQVAEAQMERLGKAGSQALLRRQAMLRYLVREPGAVNVTWLYAESGGSLADLQYLAGLDFVALGEAESMRDPLSQLEFQPSEAPQLTRDQESVWAEVETQLFAAAGGEASKPLLLHGVTGSGKTEIYLRAVQHTLQAGGQAIILVPEISLTSQTVRRFANRFPGQVGLVHSGLSEGERYDTWRRARQGSLGLVVGPRSALFTPFPHLRLIIVDECHDDTYYQDDTLPYYDARTAAAIYARISGAICLFGSATPDLTQTFNASRGDWRYLHLPARILAHQQAVQAQLDRLRVQESSTEKLVSNFRPYEAQAESSDLPPVSVIDMRDELKSGNRSIFSRPLQSALAQVLQSHQQAILFLNRRGAATYVFCRSCGHSLRCPRCDMPLTYHTENNTASPTLNCHYCGYTRRMPELCPACSSPHIRHYGAGTERVEAEIQAMFPEARTLRWDYETTRKKGAHEIILNHFLAHRADILIGTQMLAKGLDLPLVTLVGVVLADVGLNLPDYRASERTFQVLTQVAGRAGRSLLGGQVVLQTFQPDHYVIQAASRHDYRAFYQQELDFRRQLNYPPFSNLVRLEYRHLDNQQAETAAGQMAARLQGWLAAENRHATTLVGPVPCFFARMAGMYRWQIVLRGPDPASLLHSKQIGDWKIEVNPPNLL